MSENDEGLPLQAEELITELKETANLNPTAGRFVLVGQNGFLDRHDYTYRDSLVGSGLIDSNKISSRLKSAGVSWSTFAGIGRPELWEAKGKSRYEVERRSEALDGKIEAFVIEREDPTGFVKFMPRQDFVIFYSLFDRIDGPNRIWDDHMRGVSDVIKFERDESLSKISIMKNYILDYLFVRKKALLLGYYFRIVVPAQDGIPDNFRKDLQFDVDNGKARVLVAKAVISGKKLVAQMDMFKVVAPPKEKTLGFSGTLAEAPVVKLKTAIGLLDMKKVGPAIGDFLTPAYFDSDVLKKYETDRRYRIDDDGGVHYAGIWGIFRGIQRLGDEIIAVHVGDLAEGLPYQEWSHWASHNIDPLSVEEHRDLGRTKPIQQLLNTLVSEVEAFADRMYLFFRRRRLLVDEPLFKFQSEEQKEEIVRELKKTFTRKTTRNEFLNRIVELYKLLIDSLNTKLLGSFIDTYDFNLKFDSQRQPKRSLKLLLTSLELQAIERECVASGLAQEEIASKILDYYNCLQQPSLQATEDFLLKEVQQRVNVLREAFGVLFALFALRSKGGGAHLGTDAEFKQALRFLGLPEASTDFLQAYRTLIVRLTEFFAQV